MDTSFALTTDKARPLSGEAGHSLRRRRGTVLWFGFLLVLLIASRVTLAPPYLLSFDEVNFAYAIKDFNPLLQQPQPPGYPLFVGLLRLLALFIPQVENVFLTAALVASAIALASLWAVGERLFGGRTGLIAALLFLFHPSFWFAALTNPVRIFLAVGAMCVAVCLLRALSSRRAFLWYCIAAFVFGTAGGFRPDLLFTLLPLLLYAGRQLRLTFPKALVAAVIVILTISLWLSALIVPLGGIRPLSAFIRAYGEQQGGSTSILLGASLGAAAHMAYNTTIWTFAATLSWLWCVPFALRSRDHRFTKAQGQFLLVWLLSGFLFYAVVHTGDPDHTLSIIPVTCLIGAVMLERFARQYAPRALPIVVTGAVVLNMVLFFEPPNATAKAASYQALRSSDDYMRQVIETMQALQSKAPLTVVCPAFVAVWRTVSYYFPDASVLVFEAGSSQPAGWKWRGANRSPLPTSEDAIVLPGCGTIAWLDSATGPTSMTSGQRSAFMPGMPVTYMEPQPGESYTFRNVKFRIQTGSCGP